MAKNNLFATEGLEAAIEAVGPDSLGPLEVLSTGEKELMRELLYALRTIRYGSIVLTLHEGRIVELHKTERIRRNGSKGDSAQANRE